MGWLFAVSLALQEQRERALWKALPPIALGHILALVAVAVPLLLLGSVLRLRAVALVAAGALLAFGAWKLARWYRHPRWVGMKVGSRDLALWSFLMATGHGAGLMVAPALVALMGGGNEAGAGARGREALTGIGVHTAALFVVMAAVAWMVYRWVGLGILRTHWINFDLVWAVALLLTGGIALAGALGAARGEPALPPPSDAKEGPRDLRLIRMLNHSLGTKGDAHIDLRVLPLASPNSVEQSWPTRLSHLCPLRQSRIPAPPPRSAWSAGCRWSPGRRRRSSAWWRSRPTSSAPGR